MLVLALSAFSKATLYMSLAGYARYVYFLAHHVWLPK